MVLRERSQQMDKFAIYVVGAGGKLAGIGGGGKLPIHPCLHDLFP